MRRRDLAAFLGGAVVMAPGTGRAQQKAMPVVGLLIPNLSSPNYSPRLDPLFDNALHQGLRETDYVEGQNVALEYRWAEGHYDRLPAFVRLFAGGQNLAHATLGPDA